MPDLTAGFSQQSSLQGRHSGQWHGTQEVEAAGLGGTALFRKASSTRGFVFRDLDFGFADSEEDLPLFFCRGCFWIVDVLVLGSPMTAGLG